MKRTLAILLGASVLCGSASAANLTPDQLTAAISANNTDLFLLYPVGGPMKSLQWSVVKSLMTTALGSAFLTATNNLGDVPSPAAARVNLGLGSAAQATAGTSGVVVPFLNGVNTWSGAQTFTIPIQVYSTAQIEGAAGTDRYLEFDSIVAATPIARWLFDITGTAESGANAGSDFTLCRYPDVGARIDCPLSIVRSSGLITIADGVNIAGISTAPTPTAGDSSTKIATTAFVATSYLTSATAASAYAPLASPALTGNPTAPTQAPGNNSARVATTAFVAAAAFAPLASPAFTGTPTAPTPIYSDNSTKLATTAFVVGAVAAGNVTVTVATLPGSPGFGQRSSVGDATGCARLSPVTAGGAVFCPVIYNGSQWVGD